MILPAPFIIILSHTVNAVHHMQDEIGKQLFYTSDIVHRDKDSDMTLFCPSANHNNIILCVQTSSQKLNSLLMLMNQSHWHFFFHRHSHFIILLLCHLVSEVRYFDRCNNCHQSSSYSCSYCLLDIFLATIANGTLALNW